MTPYSSTLRSLSVFPITETELNDELVFAWTETADGRSQAQTAVAHFPATADR